MQEGPNPYINLDRCSLLFYNEKSSIKTGIVSPNPNSIALTNHAVVLAFLAPIPDQHTC